MNIDAPPPHSRRWNVTCASTKPRYMSIRVTSRGGPSVMMQNKSNWDDWVRSRT